jgi:sterol 24-C-methyltransferase
MAKPAILDLIKDSLPRRAVQDTVDEYGSFHTGTAERRKANYMEMVNDYYDLVTDFYEFGWGQSFHFAPRYKGERLDASIVRHEHYLAHVLSLRPGMKVLDVGCGVGGPMRTIARFSGASITGVNNNAYQIERGRKQTEEARLADLCEFVKADFMKLPMADQTFDAIYAIEATCHAPEKLPLFVELFRTMKHGGQLAVYEWCLTSRYDAANPSHLAIKKGIEEGAALPDLSYQHDVLDACEQAGFEILESRDLAETSDPETPWYLPLSGTFSISGFRHTRIGRRVTNSVVKVLETAHIAPAGSCAVSEFLIAGADALVRGGETGIFTPMFYFRARKPHTRGPLPPDAPR